MSSDATVSDSEDEGSDVEVVNTPEPTLPAEEPAAPQSVLSIRRRDASKKRVERSKGRDSAEDSIAVMVSGPQRPWEYQPYDGDATVDSVVGRTAGPDGTLWYKIEYESGKKDKVPLEQLIQIKQGQSSLDTYNDGLSSSENKMESRVSKRVRTKPVAFGFVNSATAHLGSDDEGHGRSAINKKRRTDNEGTPSTAPRSTRTSGRATVKPTGDDKSMDLDTEDEGPRRPVRASRSTTKMTSNKISQLLSDEEEDEEDGNKSAASSASEDDGQIVFLPAKNKIKKSTRSAQAPKSKDVKAKRGRPPVAQSSDDEDEPQEPSRRSGRDRGNVKSMREGDVSDEIYAEDSIKLAAAKVLNVKEVFKPLAKNSPFRILHNSVCDVCAGQGNMSNKGQSPLLYCQGCNTSIHQACIGNRTSREHVVTKVGDADFVIQCRRCVGVAAKKDPTAPNLARCQVCDESGLSCKAFSTRRTPKQEEKLREENGGVDPITKVSPDLVNNAANVLFRCNTCARAYHFEHLPDISENDSDSDSHSETSKDVEHLRDVRFKQYRSHGQCKECLYMTEEDAKISNLVAWRPIHGVKFDVTKDDVLELAVDQREYLVKLAEQSYSKCKWMPGAWVHGVTAVTMRKAFFNKEHSDKPIYETKLAIPKEYLCMEIVLDVEWDGKFRPKDESHGKANIHRVKEVLVKFLGLTYDDAVWETPPQIDDSDYYPHFEAAYHEYLRGLCFQVVSKSEIDSRLTKFRALDFEKMVLMKGQSPTLIGGQLMKYQLEGANWILYNFHRKKNVVLADDMGLGKTIQIIAFIDSLVKQNPNCWPFLIVTPNSTCPNWRREIKKWAPELRVVAFYGGKSGRDMAKEYELYAGQDGKASKNLTAHVVVTSYEGPVDKDSSPFFRSTPWVGMIVDEGQRLKNDENLLYKALKALKTPFQVLLTGTPLQNNKRELFNLLQFLDPKMNAAKLDEEYAELTKDNVPYLHELIKPFFLRRTKVEVLKALPAMSQVIIPVTMSVLQQHVYKSIFEKKIFLLKSILGETSGKKLRAQDRGNLNNILMQLRKVLSHPFLYSKAIEDRTEDKALEFRNLVDASSKFQLLEIMLPKLKERGHRVLLFSQFLDQLDHIEDFMVGLELNYRRLDGNMSALEKQKVIDEYNAPESKIFAMLLSTRAGGVGINLATADTVIIMDPDFNPHQDNQALSRAHRIGQKKPVLVFKLMTKDSAEEKIIQIGRQKLALSTLLETNMGPEEDANVDVESILKHGAAALFNKEDGDENNKIHYDSAAVDKLLDRTAMPATNADVETKSAENQLSFAQIWVNDKGTLSEDIGNADDKVVQISESGWLQILENRARAAAETEALEKATGRGKRVATRVNYNNDNATIDATIGPDDDASPAKPVNRKKKKPNYGSDSDNDFPGQVSEEEPEEENDTGGEGDDRVDLTELQTNSRNGNSKGLLNNKGAKAVGSASASAIGRSQPQQQASGHARPPERSAGTIAQPNYTQPDTTSRDSGPQFMAGPAYHPSSYAISSNGQPIQHPGEPSQYPGQRPREPASSTRSPIQRPDFLMLRNNSSNNPIPSTSLNHNRPSAPCHTCKLEHQDISRKCPRTMSNSKIRMLLDGLDTQHPKALTLYNQLRWILAARAEKKPVRF